MALHELEIPSKETFEFAITIVEHIMEDLYSIPAHVNRIWRAHVPIISLKANPMNNTNSIICSDNLSVMKNIPSSSVDLVYLDPPVIGGDRLVSSNPSNKKPFDFIKMLRSRVIEVRRILKEDGSLFCQID